MSIKVKSQVLDPELVAKRRLQLILAAIKMFTRQGFYCTTVKDIARAARVSSGLVYQYVHDKQDLLFLALMHIVEANHQGIPTALNGVTNPILRLSKAIEAYARVMNDNKDAVVLTYRESKSLTREYKEVLKSMETQTNKLISSCIDDCIQQGYMSTVQVELLTYQLVVIAHAWALKHWRLRDITNLDEYINVCIHPIWQNRLTAKGAKSWQRCAKTET